MKVSYVDPFTDEKIEFEDPFIENDKGGLVNALGHGVDRLQEISYRAVKGAADSIGESDSWVATKAQEGIDRNIEEQKEYVPTVESYKDVDSIGDGVSYVGELVAGSIPHMVAAATGVGAIGMAGGLSQEAYEAQPEDEKNVARAVTSGAGQMLLERLGIKGSLGQIGKDIMKDGVINTAKRYGKGEFVEAYKNPQTVVEFSRRVLTGAGFEGSTEVAQDALAQWGAGRDISEIDASGFAEAFVGGAAVGGTLRTSTETVQSLVNWQNRAKPIVEKGVEDYVKEGDSREQAIEKISKQTYESLTGQGIHELEAHAMTARIMKEVHGVDNEIFEPIARDIEQRRVNETSIEQMQENDPAFFEELDKQSIPPDNPDNEQNIEQAASNEAVSVSAASEIDKQAHEAATSPTNDLKEPSQAQKEAGNYKMGRIKHSGFDIGIENPQGSERKGEDHEGKKWSITMNHHYGDLTSTKGADGDALDVFVKPSTTESESIYIVDQVEPSTGKFDEHKILMGFDSKEEAEQAYLSNYQEGWQGLGNISEVSQDDFKSWVKGGDTSQAYYSKYGLSYNLPKNTVHGSSAEIINLVNQKQHAPYNKVRFGVANGDISSKLKSVIGEDVDGYKHVLDLSAVNHVLKKHGNQEREAKRGQIAVTTEDFAKISEIVSKPDSVESAGTDGYGNKLIKYRKAFNGTTFYVEEVRNKRKELALKSMWKTHTRDLMQANKDSLHLTSETPRQQSSTNESITPTKSASKKDDDIKFKLASPSTVSSSKPAKGISLNEANAVAKEFIDSYNGNLELDITIKETQEELYGSEATIEKYGHIKGGHSGSQGRGVLGLVSNNMHSKADARETLRHEILGHYGLETFNEVGRQKLLDRIVASQSEPSLKPVWDKIKADKHYSKQDINTQAEEVFAHTVEKASSSKEKLYNFIVSWLKRALRLAGLSKGGISHAEIRRLADTLSKNIRSGKAKKVNRSFKKDNSNEPKLRTSEAEPIVITPTKVGIADESKIEHQIRRFQDKFRRLKVIQKSLKVNDDNNAYLAEEAFHGKVGEDLRKLELQHINKISKLMGKYGLSQGEIDLYLIAKHAPERNAYIDTINPELKGAGSGMTDQESRSILDKAALEGKHQQYEDVANHVYAMLKETRERMVEFGLEPQDAVDTWQKQYKYYVPLKGYASNENTHTSKENGKEAKPYRTGSGFNIKGRETIKAMGRRSLAESPLLHTISDTTGAIIRARKNEVGQTFLKLVRDNPDQNLWEVFTSENPDIKRTFGSDGQVSKANMSDHTMREAAKNGGYFITKTKGKERFIKIKDPVLAATMANLGVEQMNTLTKYSGAAVRFLSSLNTTWNLPFAFSNATRDIQTAIFNINSEVDAADGKIKDEKGLAFDVVKFIPKAAALVKRGIRNNDFDAKGWFGTKEEAQFFKEFLESGAKTGWVNQKSVEELATELKQAIFIESGTNLGNSTKRVKSVFDAISDLNDIIENATRFSAYYNARKRGVSVKQASSLAKNLTVNFNRKGEVGAGLNALFMFANASIQGSANVLRALFTRKNSAAHKLNPASWTLTQKMAVGAIGASYSMAHLMSFLGGEDEDGTPYYDKIPDHIKATNFILMTGELNDKGDPIYYTVPMPYGYNALMNMGTALYDANHTDKRKLDVWSNMLSSTLSAFSPLGLEESDSGFNSLVRTLMPTLAKPAIEVMANENFFGGQIVKDYGYKSGKANAHLGDDRTWEWVKDFTVWMNDVSGGSVHRSGAIDITPQKIQHVLSFVGGAATQTVLRSTDLADKVSRGKSVNANDIPLLRRFYKTYERKSGIYQFYGTLRKLNEYNADFELLRGEERTKYLKKYGKEMQLYRYAKSQKKRMIRLFQDIKRIKAGNLPPQEQERQIRALEEKQIAISINLIKRQQQLGTDLIK